MKIFNEDYYTNLWLWQIFNFRRNRTWVIDLHLDLLLRLNRVFHNNLLKTIQVDVTMQHTRKIQALIQLQLKCSSLIAKSQHLISLYLLILFLNKFILTCSKPSSVSSSVPSDSLENAILEELDFLMISCRIKIKILINQIKSNQIKSNQIKTNQILSLTSI